jgi:hypothetical protein
MAFVISRFQENISLNPREFVLDENDKVMKFDTAKLAEDFLIKAGIPEETINEEGIFIDEEDEL